MSDATPAAPGGGGPAAPAGGTIPAPSASALPGAGTVADVARLVGALPGPDAAAPARVGVLVLVAAVGGDVLLRSGPASVATGLFAALLVVGLWWARLLRRRAAAAIAGAGVAFAVFAALRSSPWLVPLDLVAATGLLALACSLARGGRVTDLGAAALAQRVTRLLLSVVRGPGWALGPRAGVVRRGRASKVGGVLRGLLLAAPLVAVLGVLLASADVVFARLLTPDLHAGRLAGHVALALACGLGAAALCTDAASPALSRWRPRRRPLGATEGATILACLVVLFAAFSASQLVALTAGAEQVLATAGLTRAEYARSGFFQLLWVAAITLGVLGTLRAVTHVASARARRVLAWLTLAAIALTLVIVAVAVRRLALYTGVFGLTMLRLYSTLFAVWIGVVFLALAAAVRGVRADRRWVLPFAAAAGLALLAVLNVVNVEAQVARANLVAGGQAGSTDVAYLARDLSADAVPALLAHAGALDAGRRAALVTQICARHGAHGAPESPLAWNRSRSRAAAAVAAACAS